MAESNTQRQRNYVGNQARLGLVRVRLWVHKDDTSQIKYAAAKMTRARGIDYPFPKKASK